MKRVIFTGSRKFSDVDAVLKAMNGLLKIDNDWIVVHGAAAGLDTIADSVAGDFGFKIERHPANWELHGRSAGPIRNQKMLDLGADLVIAFPLDGPGTRHMIKISLEAKLPVLVWNSEYNKFIREG